MARRTLTALAWPLVLVLAAPALFAADDPVAVRYGWSSESDCRRETAIADVATSLDPRSRRPIVRGRIRHVGREPIRDVTVCFGRSCAKLDGGGVIAVGESARFEVRDVPAAASKRPAVRCSILEERAIL